MGIQLSDITLGENVFGLNVYRSAIASKTPVICFCGDSNSMGEGAGDTGNLGNASYYSVPRVLARKIGWQDGSVFGAQNITSSANFLAFDPRTNPGSFSPGTVATIGKKHWVCTGTSANPFTFTPTNLSDTVKVYLLTDISSAYANTSVTVAIDGVDKETFSTVSPAGILVKSYTVAKGAHTVSVRTTGTGTLYLFGISTYDSESRSPILIINSHGAGTLAEISNREYMASSGSFVANVIKPDLMILQTGINDMLVPTASATYKTQLCEFCDVVYGSGSDVFNALSFACEASNLTRANRAIYAEYREANRSVSASFNGAFYDSRKNTGDTYAKAVAGGFVYNANHMSRAGYEVVATDMYNVLKKFGQW